MGFPVITRMVAFLPQCLLTSSMVFNSQGLGAASTLKNVSVTVKNTLPVDVAVRLNHWRGINDMDNTKQTLAWDYVFPNDTTVELNVTFETERRDWDLWQAHIKFKDPDWEIGTLALWRTIGIDDKVVDFMIGNDYFGGYLAGEEQSRWDAFVDPGTGFPKEAVGLNSFFFVQTENTLGGLASIEVELVTANSFSQVQTFIQNSDGGLKDPLPFFFEKNETKAYSELWKFKVSRNGKRSLVSDWTACKIDASEAATVQTLWVGSDQWQLGEGGKACQGTWGPHKNLIQYDFQVDL